MLREDGLGLAKQTPVDALCTPSTGTATTSTTAAATAEAAGSGSTVEFRGARAGGPSVFRPVRVGTGGMLARTHVHGRGAGSGGAGRAGRGVEV